MFNGKGCLLSSKISVADNGYGIRKRPEINYTILEVISCNMMDIMLT